MQLHIEIPDDLGAIIKAEAQANGLTTDHYISRVLEDTVRTKADRKPLKSGRGMLAKYGSAPSAEEIDANQREMFRNFAKDL